MKIYLAGPIFRKSDSEVSDWRERVKAALPGHIFLDPAARDFRGVEREAGPFLVAADKADIRGCQVLLANLWMPSIGTTMEVLYAAQLGLLVVATAPPPWSPWLVAHSDFVAGAIEGVIDYLKRVPNPTTGTATREHGR